MMICNDCGQIFADALVLRAGDRLIIACPECKSMDIDMTHNNEKG